MNAFSHPDSSEPGTVPRPKVLYVDDQTGNLLVFKANLKRHADIRTASSGEEGLAILETEEFGVVISDQKMPGLSGTGFLAEVRRRRPDSVRILLTAYTDFDDMVAAINHGQVSRFISKPWEQETIVAAINEANEQYWARKHERARSEHRERLAAIGQVTSGLVHELGNIAAVLSVVSELDAAWPAGAAPSRQLAMLHDGIDKFSSLVESLRIYSRGGSELELTRTEADLNKVVGSALDVARLLPRVKQARTFEFLAASAPVIAAVDARKIQQVILNLVKNAAEACPPDNGAITVKVEDRGAYAIVSVRDNGPGISPEAAAKIWTGFYTSKGERGTGLGLAMCRKIVRAHSGTIDFINNPHGGCTFRMNLPCVSS